MPISINSIELENFKSYRKEILNLTPLSVLIGPNGSGKTSLLEGIRLAFDTATYKTPADYPFLPFWGYSNAVYNYEENNYIGFMFDFTIESFHLIYRSKLTGVGGALRFLEEAISLENFFEIRREGAKLSIKYNARYWEKLSKDKLLIDALSNIVEYGQYGAYLESKSQKKFTNIQNYDGLDDSRSIFAARIDPNMHYFLRARKERDYDISIMEPVMMNPSNMKLQIIPIVTPFLEEENRRRSTIGKVSPIFILYSLFDNGSFAFSTPSGIGRGSQSRRIIFIRHDSIYGMKRPVPLNYSSEGVLNGERVVVWLFKHYNETGGKVPERIQRAIEDLFPGWQIAFRSTDEGNIIIQVRETDLYGNTHSIAPPSLPDGFFKLILILSAIEMKPTMLLIDELENSLHDTILEYLIDSLRDSGINSVLTTHSPLVVNDVDLSEIRILERDANGSKIKIVDKPEEMKKKLLELGITPSDFWLYGEIA